MARDIKITRIEVHEFEYELKDRGGDYNGFFLIWEPGNTITRKTGAVKVFTDAGVVGEYVGASAAQVGAYASYLLGKNPLDRELLFNDVKRSLRWTYNATWGAVDIALWDIAGKLVDLPIYQMLGGYRRDLPCYASTDHGDSLPGGLNSPEAYADFAEQCNELGYNAFKLHVWGYDHSDTHGAKGGTVQRDVDTMHAVGQRVGSKMDLMLDGSCAYRTFHDALTVGRALDEEGFMWYEDPYSDGGVSAQGHAKLRQLLKTPLLMTEMVRGLEPKVDFIVSGGTDFVRADLGYDGGITGVMKIARIAEGFGLDVELHGNGPAHRQCMAAIRNSNYYEMGLLHPKIGTMRPPVYADGYRDGLDAIDSNGCVQVPEGPGLGVTYDWEFIRERETGVAVWE
ncbi:MAG: enolase C-terminal domain-like protein [Dehalococcoidia bacterium]|jgi:L-alanine-DL-glutamate epimerase-like enolase superfamily enzyme|nr:enolase C-terminal domain-like protein [Dehalococcoidia bacterium]